MVTNTANNFVREKYSKRLFR